MRKSPLLPIFLIVAVDVLGLTIILPLLPFYSERLGASPTVVGLLVSTYAGCQLIAGPLLGRISDRAGRRPVLLVSQLGTFIGFLILAGATTLWMVFLSRIIDGLTAGNLSLAQAYISDVTEPQDRAKSFGIIGIAFGIGFMIGPGISGYLSQFGYQYPIYVAAALSATSILSTYFLLSEQPRVTTAETTRRLSLVDWGSYGPYFRDRPLAARLWQFSAFAFSFAVFMAGFALFAERRFAWHGQPFGAKQVGYVYAYLGFLGIILQGGFIGRLVRWLGESRLVRVGFLASAAGLAALALVRSVPGLLAVSAVASLGSGLLRPALTSLITQKAGRSEQGVVLGLTQSLMSIAQITGPFLGGMLIDQGWLAGWALLAAVVAAVGLLF